MVEGQWTIVVFRGSCCRVRSIGASAHFPAHRLASTLYGRDQDMAIHDLDMSRFLMGEDPEEIFAVGSCMIDQVSGKQGNTDARGAPPGRIGRSAVPS